MTNLYDRQIRISAKIASEWRYGRLTDSAWRFYIECSLFANPTDGSLPVKDTLAWLLHKKEHELKPLFEILRDSGLAHYDKDRWIIKPSPHITAVSVTSSGKGRGLKGYVYVIGSPESNIYKIGVAADPVRRLAQLKTAHHDNLELIISILTDDAYDLEARLHDLFIDKRVRGEWFDLTRDDLTYIRDVVWEPSNE